MELTSNGENDMTLGFLRLVRLAFATQLRNVPSMARNYLMFLASGGLLRLFPFYKRGLRLGNNVRLQRISSLNCYGKQSQITIGDNTILYENAKLEAIGTGSIRIGQCSVIGDCRISARHCVSLGDRVLTSWNVFIQDNDPHPLNPYLRGEQLKSICRKFYPKFGKSEISVDSDALNSWRPATSEINIGDDVWLGANTSILKGARIGSGCIVASGSVVVAGDYPPGSILAGNPARVVRNHPGTQVPP